AQYPCHQRERADEQQAAADAVQIAHDGSPVIRLDMAGTDAYGDNFNAAQFCYVLSQLRFAQSGQP
ncbi:hypothetical protein C1X16_30375, partial [Pseudomonas sp. FW305-3-2-15-C-R2A1]|uniref:hypothetical protein n=1 Tax=Pseudomonas sp. FW305-3-2-15-C-R2A1 TaxID=2751333 RepID=UPI000CB79E45